MNADGDFYTGNKKVNSATGQEEVFDAPVPTVTGEDPGVGGVNIGFDVLSPLEASINRSLRVEGGPDRNIISEFDGPLIINKNLLLLLQRVLKQIQSSYREIQLFLESILLVLALLH